MARMGRFYHRVGNTAKITGVLRQIMTTPRDMKSQWDRFLKEPLGMEGWGRSRFTCQV